MKKYPPNGALEMPQWYQSMVSDRVSVQGGESLWGDCRFIPADWETQQ